jgi:alkaline phosphatase
MNKKVIQPFGIFMVCALFFCKNLLLNAQSHYIHSHNDYEQAVPFWGALSAGASSIEADVLLREDKLWVAHEEASITSGRTLHSLYLEPLAKALELEMAKDTLQLLIDVKSEAYTTLSKIVKELKAFPTIINSKNIRIVISGNRPLAKDYVKYPSWILFDHQSLDTFASPQIAEKVALVSLSFRLLTSWNGKGRLTKEDLHKVKTTIDQAHDLGKPFRFWASPDSKTAWKALADLGVDFINTDMPTACVFYVNSLPKRVYENTFFSEVYQPTFETDGLERTPKNIILLIGDGNGLTQISAAALANNGALTLTQLKNIGFLKTQSADDFTTDSAGAGTAIAAGQKTNNRAIGTAADSKLVTNITEILSAKGYKTGLITTDEIIGATPSAFYAHQTDRGMETEIAKDLMNSKLNLFISDPTPKVSVILENSFNMMPSIGSVGGTRMDRVAAYFTTSDKDTLAHINKFATAVKNGLAYLDQGQKPFFLMAEGAKIDSYGHENNIEGVIAESISFDKAITEAISFADTNKNTLVIITADHETGGLTIPQGNVTSHSIEALFTTHDHTGTMVPIFAYGPRSQEFQGVYENNEVFHKIVKVLGL